MGLSQRKDTDTELFPVKETTGAATGPTRPSKGHTAEVAVGDLVKLFHSLPRQNFEAELAAVVRTITSFDINIQNLIDDINHQESLANKRMKVLELEIQLFKAKIKTRQKEMDLLSIGVEEFAKSKNYLQEGLRRLDEENNSFYRRMTRKRVSKINKAPLPDRPISIAEKIKIAASAEIEQVNKQNKLKILRDKFKKRFTRS